MAEYADYLIEFARLAKGLEPTDSSKDKEIIKELQAGEKLSKSKHMEGKGE